MTVLNKKITGIPKGAIYIGRGSKWGNIFTHLAGIPNTIRVNTRDEAVNKHLEKLEQDILDGKITLEELAELHNRDLVCFCAPLRCHGQNLERWAKIAFDELLEQK